MDKVNLLNWLILKYTADTFEGKKIATFSYVYFLIFVASEEVHVSFGFIHDNIQIFVFATRTLSNLADKTTFFSFQAQKKSYV